MLIHQKFKQDLIMHSFENEQRWDQYDLAYMHQLKRWLKQQLLQKFSNLQGMRFMIERPNHLRKQISLIMAIWELGGIIVIYDLHHALMSHPDYTEFNNNIDACLIETDDIRFNELDKILCVFSETGRLHELQYWFDDNWVDNIDNDPITATENNLALMVKTSGTTRAPDIVCYTHQQVLLAAEANQQHYQFHADDHVLHLKSFHHGGLCVNYLIPSLINCTNHYFRLHETTGTFNQHAVDLTTQQPITRIMFPYEVGTEIIELLETKQTQSQNLTIHTTHNIPSVANIDRLFSTGQVSRFFSIFGCGELISAFMLQDISQNQWPQLREHWDSTVFYETPSNYWSYCVFDHGLGVKSIDMDDYYVPGDMFEFLGNKAWRWQGRNTQIKRNGIIVNPSAVQAVLSSHYPKNKIVIVPDYDHKKIYAFLFELDSSKDEINLLNEFNTLLTKEIDQYHTVDLVQIMSDFRMIINGRQSLSVLRFLARKKLLAPVPGIEPTIA